jgi:hypothetical protein
MELDKERKGHYLSPRVMRHLIAFLTEAIEVAITWKAMKPHVMEIFTSVLFPQLQHTVTKELLWQEDPYEYMRLRYGGLRAAGIEACWQVVCVPHRVTCLVQI